MRMASRTVLRLVENRSHSSRSVGKASPTRSTSLSIIALISSTSLSTAERVLGEVCRGASIANSTSPMKARTAKPFRFCRTRFSTIRLILQEPSEIIALNQPPCVLWYDKSVEKVLKSNIALLIKEAIRAHHLSADRTGGGPSGLSLRFNDWEREMSFITKLAGLAAVTVSVLSLSGAALAADYNWTFQTSETAGEPGFINKQKWAEGVGVLSGGRINIEILPIGSVVRTPIHWKLLARAFFRGT
jgi:hypothetical protein